MVKLFNDVEINDWDDVEAIDWDAFNNDVNKLAEHGVVVHGFYFPKNKLKFQPDIHVHINIAKQALIEKRHRFLEKRKDMERYRDLYKLVGTDTEKLILNKLTYPRYYDSIKNAQIQKFFNITNKTLDELYDEIFEYIIDVVQKELKNIKKIKNLSR